MGSNNFANCFIFAKIFDLKVQNLSVHKLSRQGIIALGNPQFKKNSNYYYWICTVKHLRTFFAWLFLKIDVKTSKFKANDCLVIVVLCIVNNYADARFSWISLRKISQNRCSLFIHRYSFFTPICLAQNTWAYLETDWNGFVNSFSFTWRYSLQANRLQSSKFSCPLRQRLRGHRILALGKPQF